MISTLHDHTPYLVSVLAILASFMTSLHVILSRREPGSAVAWIGLAWLVPILGSTLYLILGINRIRRRAESLRSGISPFFTLPTVEAITPNKLREKLPAEGHHLHTLAQLINQVAARPLLPGATIEPLFSGDEAYPIMLEAINNAKTSITLVTYIFDNDNAGKHFTKALSDAVARGVEVRVLIDAAGLRYSFPTILRLLRRGKITTARFLPTILPPHVMTMNLRNHRKIMVVDGHIGFTGGINIRDSHVFESNPKFPTADLHFCIKGPVVAHLQEVFADDWKFSTGEELRGERWFPRLESVGGAIARGIPDGPDEDFDKLRWTLLGAIACAQRSIRIMTPYFVPDTNMINALSLAAMRGVHVDIILPSVNNLPYVHWASMGLIRPLLEHGCNIWFTPPPFNHSKLLIVDHYWFLLGSSNWDPRSWRLNFEFNVECYDYALARKLDKWITQSLVDANPLSLESYDARSTWIKLRDGAASLLSPYL